MSRELMPTTDYDLLVWAQNFSKSLEENISTLKLDQKKVEDFACLVKDYEIAFNKAKDPDHKRTDTIAKREKAKELRRGIRIMVAENIRYNPLMTVELYQVMMISSRSFGSRSYGERAANHLLKPRLWIELGKARISLNYIDAETGRRAKPKGASMIQYAWDIAEEAPSSANELKNNVLKTSGKLVLDFNEADRGKACYIAARWIGIHGETGPWSDIDKIFIG